MGGFVRPIGGIWGVKLPSKPPLVRFQGRKRLERAPFASKWTRQGGTRVSFARAAVPIRPGKWHQWGQKARRVPLSAPKKGSECNRGTLGGNGWRIIGRKSNNIDCLLVTAAGETRRIWVPFGELVHWYRRLVGIPGRRPPNSAAAAPVRAAVGANTGYCGYRSAFRRLQRDTCGREHCL